MKAFPILNFPSYSFTISEIDDRPVIYDRIRKKYVSLTPEEWVRQHMVLYLIHQKNVPETLIVVEKHIRIYKMKKRLDIAVYNRMGEPLLLVECKSPDVVITQGTFDQIARYNLVLRVRYLVVSNGIIHHCCRMDASTQSWSALTEIPDYSQML